VHGLVCIVAVSIGALMLRNPPGTGSAKASDSSWQDTLRRPAFYLLWAMFFSGAMAGLMVIGIVKPFAGGQLVEAAKSAGQALTDMQVDSLKAKGVAAVGWLAIFNAAGRVVWGFVSDRIGRTAAFIAMFTFQAVTMFMLAGMYTELSLAVAASIIGFNFGGNFALFPSATADLFGAKNLGANYGWVFTSYGIAGVVGVAAGNMAMVKTGSYQAAFTLAAVLCALAAVGALVLRVVSKRHHAAEA
jgi:OFA family oxalate/formate antiporter-like MFS transporter